MLAKLDDLERELGNLLAALRASGERLMQGLEDLQAEVGRRAEPHRLADARPSRRTSPPPRPLPSPTPTRPARG